MRRREAIRERKRQKQAATCGDYIVADQQRMAARRALQAAGKVIVWSIASTVHACCENSYIS